MVTEIPWGDGTSDKIYLTYTAASGDQTILVSSDANAGPARTKDITFVSSIGNISRVLTVMQETNADYVSITWNDTCITYNDTAIGYPFDIPSELTKVTYIYTDGNSYILAPVQYDKNKIYIVTIDMVLSENPSASINGKGTGWNAGGAICGYPDGGAMTYGNGSNSRIQPSVSSDVRVTAKIEIRNGATYNTLTYNDGTSTGSRANTSLTTYAGSTGYPIGCMTNTGGVVPYSGTASKFYSVKIHIDGDLAFDATPVVCNASTINSKGETVASGTAGLYDYVTGLFYTNFGSGSITAG